MANESSPRRRFSVPKILYLPLILGLFAIGLLGILIPVIPGILFLGLAVVILAKVYPAFRRAIGNPGYLRRTERRVDAMQDMSWGDRGRLAGWMTLEALGDAAAAFGSGSRRVAATLRRRRRMLDRRYE
tara:strand:- start:1296 stop:1682 length:387 start_codon:yes stop_codon:yes gene_type:complete